jgi:ABC-2 type transport system ATP-binding protein
MALVQARGLNKVFKGKAAVKDLSFDVVPGSVTGFLGPNGAGKSTTMRLMLGLDNGQGVTTYDGVAYRQLKEPLRHVGSVLDAKPFHPTRKAVNHLRMLAVSNSIPFSRVSEVINIVGLGDVAEAKPKTFSLGMGQRLGIATALLGDPGTLILDEPANGLDPAGIVEVRQLVRRLGSEGRTVFISSHILSEIQHMADRVAILARGRLVKEGPVREVLARGGAEGLIVKVDDLPAAARALAETGIDTTVGEDELHVRLPAEEASRVTRVLAERGLYLSELRADEVDLETVFLELTKDQEVDP